MLWYQRIEDEDEGDEVRTQERGGGGGGGGSHNHACKEDSLNAVDRTDGAEALVGLLSSLDVATSKEGASVESATQAIPPAPLLPTRNDTSSL